MSEGAFFQDLALLMTVAGIVSVVFAKLRWPKVLGYIGAGILMSANTWGVSLLADTQSVNTIGQLGVVFLMFTLGLSFSTSELKRIKNVTIPVAILDTVIMTWIGYTIGRECFGWGSVASLFLGAAICDSATTMLAKIIDEMHWSDRPFVKYAVGTSVCEDIICVGIIALITGVAHGGQMSFGAAAFSLGGLFVFFLAVIVFGFILVPRLLSSVSKTKDDEALVLMALGCCFFISYVAYRFEFSLALGAFLIGVVASTSESRRRISDLVSPLKSMFAAVFFVSIGLLVNPASCLQNWVAILILVGVVMLGKFLNCTFGAIVSGETVKTSVQMGMGLAQIGEFAFMVAVLYVTTTGDQTCPMYDIVVSVSILTTLLNPLMLKLSEPVGSWVEGHVPGKLAKLLETYRGFVAKYHATSKGDAAHREVRNGVIELAVIAILEFAVAVALSILNQRDWSNFSVFFNAHKKMFFCLLTDIFLLAMAAPVLKIARNLGERIGQILIPNAEEMWQQAVRRLILLVVLAAGVVGFLVEAAMINVNLAPEELWAQGVIAFILLVAAIFGWRFFVKASQRATTRFNEALEADERMAKIGEMLTFTVPANALHRLQLDLSSPAIGGTVVTLNIRAKTGATIVSVERDGQIIRNVGPDLDFRVGDTLIAMGESSQIAALKDLLGITA